MRVFASRARTRFLYIPRGALSKMNLPHLDLQRIGVTLIVTLLSIVAISLSADETSTEEALRRELFDLSHLSQGFQTDTAALERQYLVLLDDYPQPENVGQIYAALSRMYSFAGLKKPQKAIEYAKRALEQPLDDASRMDMYVRLGDAMTVANCATGKDALVQSRPDIAKQYLEGILIALNLGTPDERIEMPPAKRMTFQGNPSDPGYEEAMRQNEENSRAQSEARKTNEYVDLKHTLEQQVFSLYAISPHATNELRNLALEKLQNKDYVNLLLVRAEAAIAKHDADEAKSIERSEQLAREANERRVLEEVTTAPATASPPIVPAAKPVAAATLPKTIPKIPPQQNREPAWSIWGSAFFALVAVSYAFLRLYAQRR